MFIVQRRQKILKRVGENNNIIILNFLKQKMLKNALCCFVVLVVFGGCKKSLDDVSTNQVVITNELNQFKDLSSPSISKFTFGDVKSPKLRSTAANEDSGCITTLHTQSNQFDKLSVLDPTSDIMYVGSLFDGNTIQTGEYKPIFFTGDYIRKPITVSVSLQGSSGSVVKTIIPTLSAYRTAMQEMTNAEINGEQPAATTFEVRQVRSKRELVMHIGASLNVNSGTFESTFNFDENSVKTKNYYLLKIYQKFYSAEIDIPTDGNLFNKPANYQSDVAPVYISSIDYGRSAYMLIESSYDSSVVKSALTASFKAWVVSGSANLTKDVTDVTDEMTISGTAIGGSSSLSAKMIIGLEGFHDYATKSGSLTSESRGAIIAYKLRNANDHGVYKTMINGDYYVRDCSGAKRLLYDYYNPRYGHRYTINSRYVEERPGQGWIRIVNDPIYVYGKQVAGSIPVYIMQSTTSSIYCLTTDNTIDLNLWATTGIPDFFAYRVQAENTVPIHQFYHPTARSHGLFYDRTYNPMSNGWIHNGIKFYAFQSPN